MPPSASTADDPSPRSRKGPAPPNSDTFNPKRIRVTRPFDKYMTGDIVTFGKEETARKARRAGCGYFCDLGGKPSGPDASIDPLTAANEPRPADDDDAGSAGLLDR